MTQPRTPIALALSGGGIRAMAFHLGVLRLLAERGLLESVEKISTVSGGSLAVGLIVKEAGMAWPSSTDFLSTIYPRLREKLCRRSLQWGALRQLFNPMNWQYLFSRANLLAAALQNEWDVQETLSALPVVPEWSINGTTAENGKRFRFKRDNLGDYANGYATSSTFRLADALAVSAAFPGGFGPLRIKTGHFGWRKRNWNARPEDAKDVDLGFRYLHLYDGGVYDNLGLEPFFDAGQGTAKHPAHSIIVSDAGAPLPEGFASLWLSPRRLLRIVDIMSSQSRALRIRTFASYLQKKPGRGALILINTPTGGSKGDKSRRVASQYPTTLRKLDPPTFDLLATHGYDVTMMIERKYGLVGAELETPGTDATIAQ